jgi:hypothetical protein
MVIKFKEHPLKSEIRKHGLRLYELRALCGGRPSESQLSRQLSGIDPMKPHVEARIREVVENLSE